MNLEEICKTFDRLKATRKKADKESILREALEDQLFKRVVQYALDDDKQYYVGKFPEPVDGQTEVITSGELFQFLDYLNDKGSANNADKLRAKAISDRNFHAGRILHRCFKKDLRCGVSAKTINKLSPDCVFDVPYQQCSKEDKIHNISYPAIVQRKADGMFSYAFDRPHPRTGKHFLTRNGSGYDLFGYIMPDVPKESVLTGEMVVVDDHGVVLDRKTSNGLMNEFIHGGGDEELASRVRYVVWNILSRAEFFAQESFEIYSSKLHRLKQLAFSERVSVIEGEKVESLAQARDFFKRMRSEGEEGAILKSLFDYWKYNRSSKQIKLKNISEAEFEIVSAYPGKIGKYEGLLGGLVIKTSDGKLVTRVGSGFSDKDRERGVNWWNDRAGGVITCQFTSVIDDKTGRETKCLENSRFVETRFTEKLTADILEYCEKECR